MLLVSVVASACCRQMAASGMDKITCDFFVHVATAALIDNAVPATICWQALHAWHKAPCVAA